VAASASGALVDLEIFLPSLFRFLFVIALLAAIVYGGMIALVSYVKVQPREMTQTVTLPKPPK
jgi:hypothetical protein